MSWTELLSLYIEAVRARRLAPTSFQLYTNWMRRFAGFCQARGLAPHDVAAGDVADWRAYLQWATSARGRLYSPASLDTALRAVRDFFRWATRTHHLMANPAASLRLGRVPRPLRHIPSIAEMQVLLEAPDAATAFGLRDRAILETLYLSGLRRSEWWHLDVDDVDLQNATLAVRRGKAGRPRYMPLTVSLAGSLTRYLEVGRPQLVRKRKGERALFLGKDGRRLGREQMANVLRRYARPLGLRLTPHLVRHAFATHLMEAGADLRHIQELLGHQHLGSTQIYTHLSAYELRQQFARYHPRAGRRTDADGFN